LTLDNDDDVVVRHNFQTQETITYKKISLKLNSQFNQFMKLKYTKNEDAMNKCEQNEFEYIVSLGLIQAKIELYSQKSTLLHNGKEPRKDVWMNLGSIASEFLKCYTYPKIPSANLFTILNKALGNKDIRVIRAYRKTVLLYCNIDEEVINKCKDVRLGEIDVLFFVKSIPKQYLNIYQDETSSTSSFEKEQGENPL